MFEETADLSTHTLKIACSTAQTLDVRRLVTGEFDIHATVVQLLLYEGEGAGVVGIGKTNLVQRLGRECFRQGLHVLAVVAYNDDVGNLRK